MEHTQRSSFNDNDSQNGYEHQGYREEEKSGAGIRLRRNHVRESGSGGLTAYYSKYRLPWLDGKSNSVEVDTRQKLSHIPGGFDPVSPDTTPMSPSFSKQANSRDLEAVSHKNRVGSIAANNHHNGSISGSGQKLPWIRRPSLSSPENSSGNMSHPSSVHSGEPTSPRASALATLPSNDAYSTLSSSTDSPSVMNVHVDTKKLNDISKASAGGPKTFKHFSAEDNETPMDPRRRRSSAVHGGRFGTDARGFQSPSPDRDIPRSTNPDEKRVRIQQSKPPEEPNIPDVERKKTIKHPQPIKKPEEVRSKSSIPPRTRGIDGEQGPRVLEPTPIPSSSASSSRHSDGSSIVSVYDDEVSSDNFPEGIPPHVKPRSVLHKSKSANRVVPSADPELGLSSKYRRRSSGQLAKPQTRRNPEELESRDWAYGNPQPTPNRSLRHTSGRVNNLSSAAVPTQTSRANSGYWTRECRSRGRSHAANCSVRSQFFRSI